MHIRTSKDPVGDSLFYREVPLPFLKAVQDPSRIRWRFGTIDAESGPPIVLQNLPVCGNCHSFADNGSVLGLDVDYGNDKGAYAIMPVSKHMVMDDAKIITWADYKREDGELTFGLLSRVSPTGRYVISTVKDRSVFVAIPDLMISQLFFPIKGILVVYDRETKTFAALPGADDPQYVQTNAVWSPDGKEIVFARAKAYHAERLEQQNSALVDEKDVPEFTVEKKPFRYDLYRIPFNDGKGGTPEPLRGASDDGMSNFFPKYSPDGKWIVFCKAKSYMLLQPDSELYIIPAAGGVARRLRYNTARMNSWHSWSSNSRWLVFSSKVNTPYTQLFLTHIDENGNDSPPVLLERFTSPDRAANIPEFVKLPGDAIADIREQFLDPYSFLRAGMANEHTGDHKGAERAYRRGLELAPDDAELRNALGWTLFQEGRSAEAVAEYERALSGGSQSREVAQQPGARAGGARSARGGGRVTSRRHSSSSPRRKSTATSDSPWRGWASRRRRSRTTRRRSSWTRTARRRTSTWRSPSCRRGSSRRPSPTTARRSLEGPPPRPTTAWDTCSPGKAVRMRRLRSFARRSTSTRTSRPPTTTSPRRWRSRGSSKRRQQYYERSLAEKPSAAVYNALGVVLRRLGKTDEAADQFAKAKALDSVR